MKLTRLYEIIFHIQDSSKFYTYWFALSAIYISEKQKPRLSLIFQTGFFCSLNYYQETWVDCSHGVENEQNVHQEFKWCDSSTVTLTSILVWVANWKVWREHGQNFFLKQCYFRTPSLKSAQISKLCFANFFYTDSFINWNGQLSSINPRWFPQFPINLIIFLSRRPWAWTQSLVPISH